MQGSTGSNGFKTEVQTRKRHSVNRQMNKSTKVHTSKMTVNTQMKYSSMEENKMKTDQEGQQTNRPISYLQMNE